MISDEALPVMRKAEEWASHRCFAEAANVVIKRKCSS